jgi:hypothetical protein
VVDVPKGGGGGKDEVWNEKVVRAVWAVFKWLPHTPADHKRMLWDISDWNGPCPDETIRAVLAERVGQSRASKTDKTVVLRALERDPRACRQMALLASVATLPRDEDNGGGK